MAGLILPLFGLDNPGATLLDSIDIVDGVAMFWQPDQEIKTISILGTEAGTSTWKVWFRYFNGSTWLDYQLIETNDSYQSSIDEITIFGSGTDYEGKILQLPMHLQRWRVEAMYGGQVQIERVSGSGNIVFTKGYANIGVGA